MTKSKLYDSKDKEYFKLSRSKIDLFINCSRCFYLDQKLGIKTPSGPPFLLNSAVDQLLKNEFDTYREKKEKHPLIIENNIDAIPIYHKDLDKWRHNFTGIQYHHQPTNFLLYGAIDDLWQNSQDEYIIVDYKATSKKEIAKISDDLWPGFLVQMEIYQWLFRQNGFKVSDTGYFVHCNARKNKKSFNARLEFDITLIPYIGDDSWVEQTILDIHNCLNTDDIPEPGEECDFCKYRRKASSVENS